MKPIKPLRFSNRRLDRPVLTRHRTVIQASKSKVPSELTCTGEVIFCSPKKEGDLPTFKILANNGKPMRVSGFDDPVVVNIKGAKFDKKVTPIILDHDTSLRVGHSTAQSINSASNKIELQGVVSSGSPAAQEFVADSKRGYPFQASIGATILDSTYVPEGESATVNGREWKGPLLVANRVRIREVSITVLGADNDTEVDVAAKQEYLMPPTFEEFVESLGLDAADLSDEQTEKITATYESHCKVLKLAAKAPKAPAKTKAKTKVKPVKATAVLDQDDDEEFDVEADDNGDASLTAHAAKIASEEERIDSVRQIFATYSDDLKDTKIKHGDKEMTVSVFKATAIRERLSPESVELCLMRASRTNVRNTPPGVIIKSSEIENEALAAAICREQGMVESGQTEDRLGNKGRPFGLKHYFSEKVLEASHQPQYRMGGSIQNIFELQIRAAGEYYPSVDRKSGDFMAATYHAFQKASSLKASGFSSLVLTNVLENVMNKFSLAGFDGVEGVWRVITGKKSLNDFKPAALYRLDFNGHFRKVATDGQLHHISMTDLKKTVQADTYGAMIAIDRKTMIDDDLGMVVAKASGLGTLGGQRIEEAVMVLLLANTGSFFAAGNGNLITGGTSVLGLTGLENGRAAFLNQVINGKPIGLSPSILLAGSNQMTLANQLYTQENIVPVGDPGTAMTKEFGNNQFRGLYRPYISAYLNNTAITDQDGNALTGQSATQWYLFCNPSSPQGSALCIGFLNGKDTPFFDTAETQFNIPGGVQMRSYFDFGVAFHIPQLAVKSAGA